MNLDFEKLVKSSLDFLIKRDVLYEEYRNDCPLPVFSEIGNGHFSVWLGEGRVVIKDGRVSEDTTSFKVPIGLPIKTDRIKYYLNNRNKPKVDAHKERIKKVQITKDKLNKKDRQIMELYIQAMDKKLL